MAFNMAFGKTFKLIVMFASLPTCFKNLLQADPIYNNSIYSRSVHKDSFKPEIRKIAEEYLRSKNFSVYDIPSKLKPEYEGCLNKAQDRLNSRARDWGVSILDYKDIESVTTQELDKFVKTMDSIVLEPKLDEKINDAICNLIHKSGMVKDDIKKCAESEYNSRYYKVKDKLKDTMSDDNRDYVRINEIEKSVKDELSALIKRVKGQVGSSKNKPTVQSNNSTRANGDSWQDFWDWLTGKKPNTSTTSTTDSTYSTDSNYSTDITPSAPPYNYLGEKCSICLESIKSYEKLGYLDCGHYFHERCIQTSLKSYAHKCPLCDTHTDSIAYTVEVPLQ